VGEYTRKGTARRNYRKRPGAMGRDKPKPSDYFACAGKSSHGWCSVYPRECVGVSSRSIKSLGPVQDCTVPSNSRVTKVAPKTDILGALSVPF
jgi:hypothetical protein